MNRFWKMTNRAIRVATNEVIKWIDKYFREDYPFPADDKQAI